MTTKVSYEDVQVGNEIPAVIKHPTTRQLVRFAAVTDDYYELHYDKDFAQSQGLEGVIMHGALGAAFLAQMLTDWIGPVARLKKINFRYKGLVYAKHDVVCRGIVTRKYVEANERCLECKVWLENDTGEKVTLGEALVVFPM